MISDHDSDVPYNSIMSKKGQTSLQPTCTNSNSSQKQAKWITNSTGKRVPLKNDTQPKTPVIVQKF